MTKVSHFLSNHILWSLGLHSVTIFKLHIKTWIIYYYLSFKTISKCNHKLAFFAQVCYQFHTEDIFHGHIDMNQKWLCSLSTISWPRALPFQDHHPRITVPVQRALPTRRPAQWPCKISFPLSLMNGHFKTIFQVEFYQLTECSPRKTYQSPMVSLFPMSTPNALSLRPSPWVQVGPI